jgi:hypothetical protein
MQLCTVTAAPIAATTPKAQPAISGGIDYAGGEGRFSRFSAHATDVVYGDAAGYASLTDAVDAATFATVGSRETAAGIFEVDGRFYARRLDNELTFRNGATWKGLWRLEQYPADRELLDGSIKGVTRSEALRAVVDGAQRVDVSSLPTAK